MLNEEFILDDFYKTGNNINEFESLINEIRENTKYVKCDSSELCLLSYVKKENRKGEIGFYELDPENLVSPTTADINEYCRYVASRYRRLAESKIMAKGNFAGLIKELKNDTKLVIYIKPNDVYFTSQNIMAMMDRFDMAKGFLKKPSFERDSVIAKQFAEGKKCAMCVKSIKGVKKIFSLSSDKYAELDQHVLVDIYKNLSESGRMGTPKCHHWEITHYKTSIFVEFPDEAKKVSCVHGKTETLVPGIWMATSDTSNCSLKIRGTWRKGDSITFFQEIKRKHIGEIKVEDVLKEVEETIFSEYTKLPTTLISLMEKDITDPALDLTLKKDMTKNEAALIATVKGVFKQLGVVKIIGYKRMKALLENICDEFDTSIYYTAYDIAIMMLGLVERISGLNPSLKEDLQKACGRAPYIDYDTLDAEEEIILMA